MKSIDQNVQVRAPKKSPDTMLLLEKPKADPREGVYMAFKGDSVSLR
jgi:hypothetical protein